MGTSFGDDVVHMAPPPGMVKAAKSLRTFAMACITLTFLVACGPKESGYIGLFVNAEGHVFAQLAICEGEIDSVFIWSVNNPDAYDQVRIELPSGAVRSTQVELGRFESSGEFLSLQSGERYTTQGGSNDNEWTMGGAAFQLSDLHLLNPGEILTESEDGLVEILETDPDEWARRQCSERP